MSIATRNLSKTYKTPFSRRPPLHAVREVSFEVGRGEIFALLGPNGAGKSTIVKMLAGLIKPTAGTIELNGRAVGGNNAAIYRDLSAVLEGIRNVYWRMTPLENLHYYGNLRGLPSAQINGRSQELLEMLEIEGKKKNQSQHLSRGMLQKLALATALITNPQILLLDEPTLGLDVASARKIKEVLRDLAHNQGKTILLTTHQMELVEELADRVGIIRSGELVRQGSLSDLKAVFQSYIFRFRVRGRFRVPAAWKKTGQARVRPSSPEVTEFEMDCKDRAGVYRVLRELDKQRRELVSTERVAEDLEEVFLMVLNQEQRKEA